MDKDKIIESLRLQLQKANSKISALEQELALKNYQNNNYFETHKTERFINSL